MTRYANRRRLKACLAALTAFGAALGAAAPAVAQDDDAPTPERVFEAICAAGIQHPGIVMQQALLETGRFRGPMLMSRNNLFGFRSQAYLSFPHWRDSVAYYKRWQDARYVNPGEDYFRFLVRIRYAGPDYRTHVVKFRWDSECPAGGQSVLRESRR